MNRATDSRVAFPLVVEIECDDVAVHFGFTLLSAQGAFSSSYGLNGCDLSRSVTVRGSQVRLISLSKAMHFALNSKTTIVFIVEGHGVESQHCTGPKSQVRNASLGRGV